MPKKSNKPIPPETIERIRNMRRNGLPVVYVAERFNVAISSVSKFAKGLHKETA